MNIKITTTLQKENDGIRELLKLIGVKESLSFDFKKGIILIENLTSGKVDILFNTISNFFEIKSLEVNTEKKFKIRNDEKALQSKKAKIEADIKKKPTTIISKVQAYILKEKVFTLTQLREAFPKTNFATLRAYVNDMKHENLLVELERGKYSIR